MTSFLYATLPKSLKHIYTKYEGYRPQDKKVLHWTR